jgi:hypothetical protein
MRDKDTRISFIVGFYHRIVKLMQKKIGGKKSKETPLLNIQAQGERNYSSYSFMTTHHHLGGEWSASRPGRALRPGKGHPVSTGQEAG